MIIGNKQLPSVHDFLDEYALEKEFQNFVNEARRKPLEDYQPTVKDVVKAIENRNYIGIYYEEKNKEGVVLAGYRFIEPYVIGNGYNMNSKVLYPERNYLRAFVVKDTQNDQNEKLKTLPRRKSVSKTKRLPYFRLFRLDRIQNWTIIPRKFSKYRELYNPDDKVIANIIRSLRKEEFYGEQKVVMTRELRNKVNSKEKKQK